MKVIGKIALVILGIIGLVALCCAAPVLAVWAISLLLEFGWILLVAAAVALVVKKVMNK